MLDQKSFGAKLRHHRKSLGMTQEEAAELIGISPQAVSKWESGVSLSLGYQTDTHAYNILLFKFSGTRQPPTLY